jgi:hypothetical protein
VESKAAARGGGPAFFDFAAAAATLRTNGRTGKCTNVRWFDVAEIYGWFTEGFDTADLQEARTLLEELSH